MSIYKFGDLEPTIDPTCFIAPNAAVIGDVTLGPNVTVLFGATIRGDIKPITIGPDSNVQDNCVLHVTHNGMGTHLGTGVSLGHGVILHDCTINDYCLIGMNATVLDRAVIGPYALVAAGSVVTPRTVIPEGVLAVGSPAKPVRDLKEAERKMIEATAARYRLVSQTYKTGQKYIPVD